MANIQLYLGHVHIRIEDHTSDRTHPFVLGITLEELSVGSTGDGARAEADGFFGKSLSLRNLSLYLDSDCTARVPVDDDEEFMAGMSAVFSVFRERERKERRENRLLIGGRREEDDEDEDEDDEEELGGGDSLSISRARSYRLCRPSRFVLAPVSASAIVNVDRSMIGYAGRGQRLRAAGVPAIDRPATSSRSRSSA